MNTKVLASLGVIVALLTAWLFASVYASTNVSVEGAVTAAAAVERSPGPLSGSVFEGQSAAVKTSVNIANQDVQTTVRVAE